MKRSDIPKDFTRTLADRAEAVIARLSLDHEVNETALLVGDGYTRFLFRLTTPNGQRLELAQTIADAELQAFADADALTHRAEEALADLLMMQGELVAKRSYGPRIHYLRGSYVPARDPMAPHPKAPED